MVINQFFEAFMNFSHAECRPLSQVNTFMLNIFYDQDLLKSTPFKVDRIFQIVSNINKMNS